MKILFLTWNFPPVIGGIENVVDQLYKQFIQLGHDVKVLTQHGEATGDDNVERANRPGLRGFVMFSLVTGLRRAFRWRPDLVLCGSLVSLPGAFLIHLLTRRPYFCIVYGSDILKLEGVKKTLLVGMLNHARGIIAISQATHGLALEAGLRRETLVVIPPGVDLHPFDRAEPGAPDALKRLTEKRFVILSVGRLVKRKGVTEFVGEVMPWLIRDHPEVLYLVVGDDPTRSLVHAERQRKIIEATIKAEGLENHVRLLGEVAADELNWLFRRAELFVMPCLDLPGDVEGFGIVFLEAGLGGAPSVATRVGGIPDAIVDGETGLLATPGDFKRVHDAVKSLIENPELRERMGRAAGARARREFSWPQIARRYIEYFEERVS